MSASHPEAVILSSLADVNYVPGGDLHEAAMPPTSDPEGLWRRFRAAAWIVTNKTNGFGLSFGSRA